jgi:chemotaxis protein histidine kinase CheA
MPVQFDISDGPARASGAQASAEGTSVRTSSLDKSPGGENAAQAPTADPTRTTTTGGQMVAKASTAKWRGPRVGDNRWGGQAWRKQHDGPNAAAPGAGWNSVGGGGAVGSSEGAPTSSSLAKEQAERLLEQRANLLAAQAKEREAAEAARVQSAEVARLQQLQQEQQRQAMADAAAAAEALRQAQQAMAEAEAQEAARQERERQALVARTSPEELRRAQELHAQQAAIAAAGFGTAQAAAGAEMLQAAAPLAQVQGAGGFNDDAEHIMGMSPEELAEAQRGSMDVGQCPW